MEIGEKKVLWSSVQPWKINKIKLSIWNITSHSSKSQNYSLSNSTPASLRVCNQQDRFAWGQESKRLASARRTPLKMKGFIQTLSQFVSFNILLKCHSAIWSGPLCLCCGEVNMKKAGAVERVGGKSHHCPRRRSGRGQKWHFPLAAARSRCSGHRYQL